MGIGTTTPQTKNLLGLVGKKLKRAALEARIRTYEQVRAVLCKTTT